MEKEKVFNVVLWVVAVTFMVILLIGMNNLNASEEEADWNNKSAIDIVIDTLFGESDVMSVDNLKELPMEELKGYLDNNTVSNIDGVLVGQDEQGNNIAYLEKDNVKSFNYTVIDGDNMSITDTTLSDGTVSRIVTVNGVVESVSNLE